MNIKSRLKTSSVAFLMVAVVALLIIPLPTGILDFMFILNLTISLVILFIIYRIIVHFIKKPRKRSLLFVFITPAAVR